jgi:O-antigen ligase
LGFVPFVLNNFKDEKKRLGILNSLLAVIVVVSIFGWMQYFLLPDFRPFKIFGWDDHLFRLIGTFLDPTYIGLILVFGVNMALVKYQESRKKKLLIFVLFFLITIAFTYSRASYLALAGSLTLYAFWQKKYLLPSLVVIIFAVTVVLLPRPSSEGVQLERTNSIYGRFRSYSEGLAIFAHNPVFGVGFNNYCYARQIYLKTNDLFSHACSGSDSSLLNILVTTGVVGFSIFIGLLISIYKRVKPDKYGIIFIICSAALFVHSFFSNSLFYTWILSFMAISMGLISRSNEG